MSETTRHPLSWPTGRTRTPPHKRQRPKFKVGTFAQTRDELLAELRRHSATGIVLSTNVELRGDGLPYSGRRNPEDPGVAVYFTRKGKHLAFACDQWVSVEENMRAIADVIACIRTIERRGTGEMVDSAFLGFQALPAAPRKKPWYIVLDSNPETDPANVEAYYRELSKRFHPDRNPGDPDALERYHEVQEAYTAFKKERGL